MQERRCRHEEERRGGWVVYESVMERERQESGLQSHVGILLVVFTQVTQRTKPMQTLVIRETSTMSPEETLFWIVVTTLCPLLPVQPVQSRVRGSVVPQKSFERRSSISFFLSFLPLSLSNTRLFHSHSHTHTHKTQTHTSPPLNTHHTYTHTFTRSHHRRCDQSFTETLHPPPHPWRTILSSFAWQGRQKKSHAIVFKASQSSTGKTSSRSSLVSNVSKMAIFLSRC